MSELRRKLDRKKDGADTEVKSKSQNMANMLKVLGGLITYLMYQS